MVRTAEIVIVGGGVIGASAAFHLARAGVKNVVVVERRYLAAGASGKSGALVRMHYTNEPETRLARESLNYFQNWSDVVGGDCGFRPVGFMALAPPELRSQFEANVAMQQRVGVNTQLIGADDARQIDPTLWTGDGCLIAYEPESGYADPAGTTYAFARAAMNLGVEFHLETVVRNVRVEGARVTGVETNDGAIDAPIVLVCAGAWANHLLGPLSIDLGLVPTLSRISIFRGAFERGPRQLTYIDHVNHTWLRPIDGASTLIGAESGVGRSSGDPDHYSETVGQEYVDHCRAELVRRFPVMRHAPMRGNWCGIFMGSPDWHPIIGRLPQYDGLYCMTGDSGSSFKTSPAVGKCLAELIVDGEATTVDLTPFRPTRFAEGQPWHDENSYSDQLTISR
jgi:sarcosine oxidase subunit beta